MTFYRIARAALMAAMLALAGCNQQSAQDGPQESTALDTPAPESASAGAGPRMSPMTARMREAARDWSMKTARLPSEATEE
jgi:uncharacterized lipoprotein NlpE involved in copper resistance